MSLKTRLLAGASALAVAGGMIGLAAPAAHAAPTVIGAAAVRSVWRRSTTRPTSRRPLGDQTQIGVDDQDQDAQGPDTQVAIAGDCSSASRPGDPINPPGGSFRR